MNNVKRVKISTGSSSGNNSSSSHFITQLQDTTTAVKELQSALEPCISIIQQHATVPSLSNHITQPPTYTTESKLSMMESNVSNDLINDGCTESLIQQQQYRTTIAVAQTLVALTVATICYLQPRLIRTSTNNKNVSCTNPNDTIKTSSTTTIIHPTNKNTSNQQQQIRSDLNHIRQLLKSVQDERNNHHFKKRKNTSIPETATTRLVQQHPSTNNVLDHNKNKRPKNR
jgi:hypothetical protein